MPLPIKLFIRNFNPSDIAGIIIYLCWPSVIFIQIDLANLYSYAIIASFFTPFIILTFLIRRGIHLDLSQSIIQPELLLKRFLYIYKTDAITLAPPAVMLIFGYFYNGHTSPLFVLNIMLAHATSTILFTCIKMQAMRSPRCSVITKIASSLSTVIIIPISYKVGHPKAPNPIDTFETFYNHHDGAICIALLIICAATAYGILRHVRNTHANAPFPSSTVIQQYNKNYWY